MPGYDLQAAAPALSDWIVSVEAAGPAWGPPDTKLGQFFLIPGVFRLDYDGLLNALICTATMYLDSQQKWKQLEFAEHGLCYLLRHLATSMRSAAKVLSAKQQDVACAMLEVEPFFDILSTASRFCCTPVCCTLLSRIR